MDAVTGRNRKETAMYDKSNYLADAEFPLPAKNYYSIYSKSCHSARIFYCSFTGTLVETAMSRPGCDGIYPITAHKQHLPDYRSQTTSARPEMAAPFHIGICSTKLLSHGHCVLYSFMVFSAVNAID